MASGKRSLTTSVLHTLRARLETLPPGERRVGEMVFRSPEQVLAMSTAELASAAGVSDPTVVRFARSLGLNGVSELKLRLAADVARGPVSAGPLQPGDGIGTVMKKLAVMAVASLSALPDLVDHDAAQSAAQLLSEARSAIIVGFGASLVDAMDLSQRLLGVTASVVETDMFHMLQRLYLCTPEDVLVVFSHSGGLLDLLEVMDTAEKTRVRTVAFAPPRSPIASRSTCSIGLDLPDDTDLANPSLTRITTAMLIESVVTAIEMQNPEKAERRRELAQIALTGKRAKSGPHSRGAPRRH